MRATRNRVERLERLAPEPAPSLAELFAQRAPEVWSPVFAPFTDAEVEGFAEGDPAAPWDRYRAAVARDVAFVRGALNAEKSGIIGERGRAGGAPLAPLAADLAPLQDRYGGDIEALACRVAHAAYEQAQRDGMTPAEAERAMRRPASLGALLARVEAAIYA